MLCCFLIGWENFACRCSLGGTRCYLRPTWGFPARCGCPQGNVVEQQLQRRSFQACMSNCSVRLLGAWLSNTFSWALKIFGPTCGMVISVRANDKARHVIERGHFSRGGPNRVYKMDKAQYDALDDEKKIPGCIPCPRCEDVLPSYLIVDGLCDSCRLLFQTIAEDKARRALAS